MTARNDIERLFRNNYQAMLALAFRLTHDLETARDIVHDVFAELIDRNLSSVNASYLLQGVRFASLKFIRNLSIRERIHELYALDLEEIEDEKWPDEEDIVIIKDILHSKLSGQTQRVVNLKFRSKLSYREIADELSISETAVYKHLRHALEVLRQNFNSHER